MSSGVRFVSDQHTFTLNSEMQKVYLQARRRRATATKLYDIAPGVLDVAVGEVIARAQSAECALELRIKAVDDLRGITQ